MFYLYPFLSNSPTGQTADHAIFTLDGSINAHSCKGVPFWLWLIAPHLGDQLAQNPNFWVVNRRFPAKHAKY